MVITQPSHSNTRPFANRTTFNHFNTGLVRYSDGYCIQIITVIFQDQVLIIIFFRCRDNRGGPPRLGPSQMNSGLRPCKFWMQNRKCNDGPRCRFPHPQWTRCRFPHPQWTYPKTLWQICLKRIHSELLPLRVNPIDVVPIINARRLMTFFTQMFWS